MILVDTNVIIEYWKRPTESLRQKFLSHEIVVCGIVLAELLHGAQNEEDERKIREALQDFHSLTIPESLWADVGSLLFSLKTNGIQIPFQDAVIFALCKHHQCSLDV
ncbi:MAG TPA: PIN domain-containing protein [Bacteroidota bacterium]|nr:PIN domain-containing protein [Bacteroidota bacterium]